MRKLKLLASSSASFVVCSDISVISHSHVSGFRVDGTESYFHPNATGAVCLGPLR